MSIASYSLFTDIIVLADSLSLFGFKTTACAAVAMFQFRIITKLLQGNYPDDNDLNNRDVSLLVQCH